ncbi:MAG: AraC family transcriptional regulator [Clostridia bacterium]|nr:AraC family transcriptional regulator [Clostridia bacterium]
MNKETVLAWLDSDVNFKVTKMLKQHWEQRKYSYMSQGRPDFGLMLLLRGNVDFVTEDGTISARAGNVIFLPKNSRYEAIFRDKADDYLICFDACESDLFDRTPMILSTRASLFCVEQFRVLAEENIYNFHTNARNRGQFYLLLNSIITDEAEQNDEQAQIIKRACELLVTSDQSTVDEIAKECAVSASTLRKMFKQKLGSSPTQYRTNMKLRKALYFIESTSLTVNEIAEQLNFFDAAYFCKVFRERFGMSPKQYAKTKKL